MTYLLVLFSFMSCHPVICSLKSSIFLLLFKKYIKQTILLYPKFPPIYTKSYLIIYQKTTTTE